MNLKIERLHDHYDRALIYGHADACWKYWSAVLFKLRLRRMGFTNEQIYAVRADLILKGQIKPQHGIDPPELCEPLPRVSHGPSLRERLIRFLVLLAVVVLVPVWLYMLAVLAGIA